MELFKRSAGKKTRGQTMVEFALVLPILLMTMYGIMEFGRLLFIFVTTASASREAARYAAAVGISENGVPFYNDCAGMRSAAQRVGILAGIDDTDVIIQYDKGPGIAPYSSCPVSGFGPELGDRILVTVTGHFEPIVPIVPIPIRDIQSVTARTIIRDVRVSENFIAPQIVSTQPPSPYVTFESSQTDVGEDVGIINVTVQTDIPVPADSAPLEVQIGVIDVLEALGGGKDYQINSSLTMVFQEGDQFKYIEILINNDDLFENTERIILYVRRVSNNNLGYPRLHVIRIGRNDEDNMPFVYFYPSNGTTISESDEKLIIPVLLDRPSGVAASVEFTITPLISGPGYTPVTGRLDFPIDYSSPYRTVTTSSAVIIFPIDDIISTDDTELLIELTNPVETRFDITDPITHPYTLQVTILDDDPCALTATDIQSVGNDYWVDILNSGRGAVLSGMYVDSTEGVNLNGVLMNGIGIWSGPEGTPVEILSSDWNGAYDRKINPGTQASILLQFDDPTTTINSWSLDFGSCGVMTIAPPAYSPTP